MPAAELALVVRSRGVGGHLLSRESLESLADAADVASLSRGLAQMHADLVPMGGAPGLDEIERSAARTAGRHLRTLLRWQQNRPGALHVFIVDQERRSLRALLRGARQGAPAAARLAGLLPTPALPVGALAELARQASPAAVVSQLMRLGYSGAAALLPLVAKAQPELFSIEVALLRGMAAQAGAAAVQLSEPFLRNFVHERIDLGNLQNALLLADGLQDVRPADAFVGGGRWLTQAGFVEAASSASRGAGLARLTTVVANTPLLEMLPVVADDAAFAERTLFTGMMARLARDARRQPLSAAPLLRVLLRIEAQSRDLRTLAWGAALGTPPAMRRQELVTPWH